MDQLQHDSVASQAEANLPSAGAVDFAQVEIPLEEELVNVLHRRSRRQLRNIQAASTAVVKLCRVRKVLQVSGTCEAIQQVQHHLESLNGPKLQVPVAVWAELMRTRTVQLEEDFVPTPPIASIAAMQLVTNCRIHVERSRCEVRLFGARDAVEKASELIALLVQECSEEHLLCRPDCVVRRADMMQAFGEKYEVMLRATNTHVFILGLRGVVDKAVMELRACIAEEREFGAIDENYSSEGNKTPDQQFDLQSNGSSDENIQCQSNWAQGGHAMMQGQNRPHQPTPQPQPHPQHQQHQGQPQQNQRCIPSTCPTCGAGRFCVSCGAPVYQNTGNWVWVGEGQPDVPAPPMPPNDPSFKNHLQQHQRQGGVRAGQGRRQHPHQQPRGGQGMHHGGFQNPKQQQTQGNGMMPMACQNRMQNRQHPQQQNMPQQNGGAQMYMVPNNRMEGQYPPMPFVDQRMQDRKMEQPLQQQYNFQAQDARWIGA